MNVSYETVRDKYNYDDKTGWLTWKNHRYKSMNETRSGCLCKTSGYRVMRINNKTYKEHRIIWLWKYGYLPENEIDHINRIKDCNWISNLREAKHSCNIKNIGLKSNNKTGIVGIIRLKNGKYEAYITNEKTINLGHFDTLLDGAKARYKGEVKYNYENCNSTSTAYQYIKDNDPEWLNGEMKVEKNKHNENKSSGIKGVSFHKPSNKWVSYININKKRINLGSFNELEDAVMSRYEAEVKHNQTKDSQSYNYLIGRNLI